MDIPAWLFNSDRFRELQQTNQRIILELIALTDDAGESFPSQKFLSRRVYLRPGVIGDRIKYLEDNNIIQVTRFPYDALAKKRQSNSYRVNLEYFRETNTTPLLRKVYNLTVPMLEKFFETVAEYKPSEMSKEDFLCDTSFNLESSWNTKEVQEWLTGTLTIEYVEPPPTYLPSFAKKQLAGIIASYDGIIPKETYLVAAGFKLDKWKATTEVQEWLALP